MMTVQTPTSAAIQGRASPPPSLLLPEQQEVELASSDDGAAFRFLDPARQKHTVPDWASLEGLVVGNENDQAKPAGPANLRLRLGLAAVASVPVVVAAQVALACLKP